VIQLPDGIGRTLFIAALAGSIFAAFLLVTPRLAAIGGEVAAGSVGAIPGTTTTAPSTTTAAAVTSTTTSAVTTTTAGTGGLPSSEEPLVLHYDGTIRLSVIAEGPLGGKEWSLIADGDEITWRLHIENTSDERLWGVFAWLELGGRAECDSHRLAPKAEMDCLVTTTAYAGDWVAEAWVDAWTSTRQVRDKVFYELHVSALGGRDGMDPPGDGPATDWRHP